MSDIVERAAKHVAALNGHSDDWERYVEEAADYCGFVLSDIDYRGLILEHDKLRTDLAAAREFMENLRMHAVHAESAELTLRNTYIIARIDAALKGDGNE